MIVKKYIIAAVLIGAFASGVAVTKWYWSDKYNSLIVKLKEAETENLNYILEIERLNRDKANLVQQKLIAEENTRKAKAKVITKEVVKYVETNSNSSCLLDDDWVRIHTQAIPMPRASEAPAGATGGESEVYNLGEALEVDSYNYDVCQQYVNKLNAWREWYKRISEKQH